MTVTLKMPVTHTMTPCVTNPNRWADGGNDPALKALCRRCPRRWLCAKEALHTPAVQGMIAGVHVPDPSQPGPGPSPCASCSHWPPTRAMRLSPTSPS